MRDKYRFREEIRPSNIPVIASKRRIIRHALQREVSHVRKNFLAFSARDQISSRAFRQFCKGCFFPHTLPLATPRCWRSPKSPEIRGLTFYRTTGLYCSGCRSTKREGIKSTVAPPGKTSPVGDKTSRLRAFRAFCRYWRGTKTSKVRAIV